MTAPKPVALIILDGFGLREEREGNAVAQANKPNFDRYWSKYPHTTLRAFGEAVGLPEGQMGNSEVGHLNIGAGRIVYQDLTRITKAIEDKSFYENDVFLKAARHVKDRGSSLHLMGLLSDGGVHSHNSHLYALLRLAKEQGLERVYVHAFLDGRDVAPDSGVGYLQQLLCQMEEIGTGELASVQGRYYAMDRDKRWDRVEKAYRAIVDGAGPETEDPVQAVRNSYADEVYDEFVIPTVCVRDNGEPVGKVSDGDALICFNFRPDRVIQISRSLTNDDFDGFKRDSRPRGLYYVCMTKYSDTVEAPIAFPPQRPEETLGEVVSKAGLKQLRIAETEKYPHVTFFFSGGREDEFPGEERILIDSPKVATYDLKPEMSVFEVTEALIGEINKRTHDLIVLNFANPDMVGHSGKMEPTIRAVEAVDECLGRVVDAVLNAGGVAVITADHGNADMLIDEEGHIVTSHTTNPVPFVVTKQGLTLRGDGILADIAPTLLHLMDQPQPDSMTGKSIIDPPLRR